MVKTEEFTSDVINFIAFPVVHPVHVVTSKYEVNSETKYTQNEIHMHL